MPPVAVQLSTLRDARAADQDAVIEGVAALEIADDTRPLDAPRSDPLDREIGTGRLDFHAIASASAGAGWWIAEHDTCVGLDPASVGHSLDAVVHLVLARR